MKFGHQFRQTHFGHIPSNATPVNHGSYGLVPTEVLNAYKKSFDQDNAFPDWFFKLDQHTQYNRALEAVSNILNSPVENLAFVENDTTGINAILRSLPFKKGDKIAMASTTYGACANTVRFLQEYIGTETVVVDIEYPAEDKDVVAAFESMFRKHNIRLAMFDTVVSMPGVRVPWEELVHVCRRHGVLSMVDGAHGIGLIDIDLASTKPDFFCSNLHKWLFVPRGCAVLYVDEKHHLDIQTLPISHSYVPRDADLSDKERKSLMLHKFAFTGLKCFAAVDSILAAIEFRNHVCGGEAAINAYCWELARKTGQLAEKRIPGAHVVENSSKSLVTAMVTVYLDIHQYTKEFDFTDSKRMMRLIDFVSEYQLRERQCFVPTGFHAGRLLARFSCHVYNELSDYEIACDGLESALRAFFRSKL